MIAVLGCRGDKPPEKKQVAVVDAGRYGWPELAELPRVEAAAVIELPITPGQDASVVGPVVIGDLAIIGSSRMGFVAIEWRTGRIAWRRGAGAHLAPPVAHGGGALVVADCERAPLPPTGLAIVGCWRVVDGGGADLAAGTIAGAAAASAQFIAARGPADLVTMDHEVLWSRGDHAVMIDLDTGRAEPRPPQPARAIARHKDREWQIAIEPDGALVARDAGGAEQWRTQTAFAAVIGVVPGESYEVPMVRVVNLAGAAGRGVVDLIDIEVTGSKHGHAGATVPGIQLLGHAFALPGATALAVRLDSTLQHDFISAHDARGGLAWVWPLPERMRADPVGLAITDDAVLVFHDGDRLTVLPAVSRPPTSAGAGAGTGSVPSKNPTP